MKNRNIPCTECRKHRRKCIRTSTSESCVRCERLGKLCLQPTQSTTAQYSDSEDASVDQLQQQVEQLELAIRQMEDQMKKMSCRSNNSSNNNNESITTLTRVSSHHNTTTNSAFYEDMIKKLMYSWQIQIKNGTFQIETGIRNVSDLLPFQFDITGGGSIPYLSPLSGGNSSSSSISSGNSEYSFDESSEYYRGESGLVMQFGQEATGSMPFTVTLLTKCAKKSSVNPATLSLPSSLLLDPFSVIDQLIQIYFNCHNIHLPMVHERSFMEKYKQLRDPLSDLVCISLCCYVCSTPCEHFIFSAEERRNMADYFFAKAKQFILDQFDDPDKRLENIISINALSKYMHMTLKFKECRRLISIAYQLCLDLRNDYKATSPSDCLGNYQSHKKTENLIQQNLKDPASKASNNIDHVLYTRHVAITLCVKRFMDFVSNSIMDDSCFHFPSWLYADDDPDTTKLFVQSQNWVLGFFNLPFIGHFMNQIHKVHLGRTCTLSFESIVRIEDVINEWCAAMPEEFRLCEDLKNEELCKAAIDQAHDRIKLISFIHFHIFLIGIYSCLLQPIALGTESDQLLSFVQQHSLENSLKGCRLLIRAVHRMSIAEGNTKCHYILAASDFTYHAIDVLILLAISPNAHVAKEARAILKECLNEVDSMPFMQDHRVSKNVSPIQLGLIDFNDPTSFNLEFYDQYPQPWFAMMYDASHYIADLY